MFAYDNIIVSDEILEARFACDLNSCRGICCTDGDAGAPLTNEEADFFNNNMDKLNEFPAEYTRRFNKYGVLSQVFIKRLKNKTYCTATCNNGDCVFSFKKNEIYYCYLQNSDTIFKKPISCYLFPIRERITAGAVYLNLFIYDECECCYDKSKPPLIHFLKDVLIERYGRKFYDALAKEVASLNER